MIHVDEFISCDEDGNEVAELLAVISLTCCNPARKYNNCLAQKKKKHKKRAFPKKFCLGILFSLMNELFTELEKV